MRKTETLFYTYRMNWGIFKSLLWLNLVLLKYLLIWAQLVLSTQG